MPPVLPPLLLPIVHHAAYDAEFPASHRFPMRKFARLMAVLREDGIARADNIFAPEPAPFEWLALAHDPAYVEQVLTGRVARQIEKDIGFAMSQPVLTRARCATGGSVLTARLALAHGLAANTAGGSHHARREQGAGFCVFNDVAVAIRVLQKEGLIRRALIVDLDVHQGDGTAAIFENDPSVFTLSVHAENNYPDQKRRSSRDIGLPDATKDDAYLSVIREVLPLAIEQAAADIVFYNAGVDPHAEDRLGRLSLSDDGLIARDDFVIGAIRSRGLPLACVIGGGYMRDIDRLARRHSLIHRTAADYLNRPCQKP